MKVKICGIGKCGVRIAYDLFAFTLDISSSYEIRIEKPKSKANQFLQKAGLSPRKAKQAFKTFLDRFRADPLYRISEPPLYVTIDSDVANNEIVGGVMTSVEGEEGKEYKFPGKNYDLNGHKGGCNFHVVSESLARTWNPVPADIVEGAKKEGDIDIYVTSFSVAGGTGGGSAPIISQAVRATNKNSPCHYMGLGVLPKSDEQYQEHDVALTMPDYEKFSTGRFLASMYGKRIPDGMNSLWLFSNDALRFLLSDQQEQGALTEASGEMNLNLSLVNFLIARSLSLLANSSSPRTKADSNADSRELNDFLDERPFISATAQREVEGHEDADSRVRAVKKLLRNALTNIKNEGDRLEGLSVPVYAPDLAHLEETLEERENTSHNEFLNALAAYDATKGPLEFRTTYRLVIFYGQPDKRWSETKKDLINRACNQFFPNAQQFHYHFRHFGSTETLLLFLVDPFLQPIVSAIYYYTNNAWSTSGENLQPQFDDLIAADRFTEPKFFEDKELFPNFIYGGGQDDVQNKVEANEDVAIKHEHIVGAFRHLHEIYNRRRPTLNVGPRLRGKDASSASENGGTGGTSA